MVTYWRIENKYYLYYQLIQNRIFTRRVLGTDFHTKGMYVPMQVIRVNDSIHRIDY